MSEMYGYEELSTCRACGKVGVNRKNPQGTKVIGPPLGWGTVSISATIPVRNFVVCGDDMAKVDRVCHGLPAELPIINIPDVAGQAIL